MYLLFLLFLAAATMEGFGEARAAAASTLVEKSDGRQSLRQLNASIQATLRDLGGRPKAGDPINPWRLTARGRTAEAASWLLPAKGRTGTTLAKAEHLVVKSVEAHGGRILATDWGLSWGYLFLMIKYISPVGDLEDHLELLVKQTDSTPVAIKARAVRPAPKPVPPRKTPRHAMIEPVQRQPKSFRVAIVVDDVGIVQGTEGFIALPAQLTFAVLPLVRYSEYYARMAAASGRTVILHLPMDAIKGNNPGPGAIRAGFTPEQIEAQLQEDLASVPGAAGVNNHMGSLGTSDSDLMGNLLQSLRQRNLYFLDSRTWQGSVAGKVARSIGEKHANRDLFLDPTGASQAQIEKLLRQLISLARSHGSAVGICHANRPHTLEALRVSIPKFAAAGVEIVPVTALMQ